MQSPSMNLLSIFRRADYTSDATQFIEQLKVNKPTLEAEQRAGRALLWDKNLKTAEQADFLDATVAQQPYVYSTGSHPNAK
jgi:hypothetical protein